MFLSINTATNICSVSIYDGNEFQTLSKKNTKEHSKYLPLFTQKLIKDIKNDLKYIALCIGPGSFAGLKIGSSFAKGLAKSLEIPIVPVNIFDAFQLDINDDDKYYVAIYSHKDYAFSYLNNNTEKKDYKCIKVDKMRNHMIYGYGFPEELNLTYSKLIPCSEKIGLSSIDKSNMFKFDENDKVNPIFLYTNK
tara:strand:- start:698 stop:1276 length:579 start_codon:yes stop_codon:yes gene_type:complete